MIIELETANQIVYSNAAQHDLEDAIRTTNILMGEHEWLERIETKEGIDVLCHSVLDIPTYTVISYNEVEQELTVNFQ